jgi:hypothetical protein
MIVRTQYFKFRELLRPVRYPLCLGKYGGLTETFEPGTPFPVHQLIFFPVTEAEVYFPDVYIKEEEVPYSWQCESCLAGSGRYGEIFQTDRERIGDLVQGKPSEKQMNQIRDHARQHEIMWAWARGLEKQ